MKQQRINVTPRSNQCDQIYYDRYQYSPAALSITADYGCEHEDVASHSSPALVARCWVKHARLNRQLSSVAHQSSNSNFQTDYCVFMRDISGLAKKSIPKIPHQYSCLCRFVPFFTVYKQQNSHSHGEASHSCDCDRLVSIQCPQLKAFMLNLDEAATSR